METTFTRTDTKVIKGVAVLLMLMHHLFYFPDNRPYSMPEYGRPCRTLWARGWKRCWASLASSACRSFSFWRGTVCTCRPGGTASGWKSASWRCIRSIGRSFSSLSPLGSCFSATRAIIARRRLTAMYLSSGACRSCSRHCSA